MTATPRTYLIVPSTAVPRRSVAGASNDSSLLMVSALMMFLDTLKWRHATKENEQPDLLIIIPRRSDQLTIEDLIFLRSASECKRILVLDIAHRLPALPPELLLWLNVINSPSFDVKHMGVWLVSEAGSPPKGTKHVID